MKASRFNISDYLENKDLISEYLRISKEEGNRKDQKVAKEHALKAIAKNNLAPRSFKNK